MTEQEYVPLPAQVIDALPDAHEVGRRLMDAMDTLYCEMVEARGDVTRPEDTFAVQRKLASWHEQAKGLKAAFEAARRRTGELMEDELVAAVGEQDGVPNTGITVPDAGGDIRLSLATSNKHHIDLDTLVPAVAAVVLQAPNGRPVADFVTDVVNGDSETPPEELENVLASIAMSAMWSLINQCGNFEPQVSKVRAYADQVARDGDDSLSSVVRGTIRTTRKYNGVKMERKDGSS